MEDRPDPVTRLGPDSGGRDPGAPADMRVYTWEWGPDQARRPGLPWIGIFLLVFGALLLLQQLFPGAEALGSVLVLAIGIAFLVKWAIDRGTGSLYAGAIITALAAPGVINAAGIRCRWPRHVLLRRRLPVHRGRPRRPGRWLGLAGDLRWPAGPAGRGQHAHPGGRWPAPAGGPARARGPPGLRGWPSRPERLRRLPRPRPRWMLPGRRRSVPARRR